MKKQLHVLIILFLVGSVQLFAQPTNDNLTNFIEVSTLPYSHHVTATQSDNATIETDEVTCGINRTWWYRYTTTAEQLVQLKAEMSNATTGQITNEVRLGFYMDLDNDNAHPLQKIDCRDNNDGAGFGENETMLFEANTTYYIQVSTSALVNAQDAITLIMTPFVLPVELTQFSGKVVENGIQLIWETASEYNNAGFELQHSWNAKEWQKLSFVLGRGTASESQYYSYLDEAAKEGENYYRIKQIDIDGQHEYSRIIQINHVKTWEADVFPNPTTGRLTIRGTISESPQLQLTNILGQVVLEAKYSINELDISHLSSGLYWLTIQLGVQKQTHLIRLRR
jgi:hypothetical protein